MREYSTECLVLDKEDLGELDKRVFLYTRTLGKIRAKIKSGRRITSKLSPHLEPLDFSKVRIIDKNGYQVADALCFDKLPLESRYLKILASLKNFLFDGQPDLKLWSLFRNKKFSSAEILRVLGFDPNLVNCERCHSGRPKFFLIEQTSYLCGQCFRAGMKSGDYIELSN